MVQLVWTNRAKKDLRQITEYISRDSVIYAKNQVNKIFKKAEVLSQLPLAGKMVQEINDRTIREIVEGNYRRAYSHNIEYTTQLSFACIRSSNNEAMSKETSQRSIYTKSTLSNYSTT